MRTRENIEKTSAKKLGRATTKQQNEQIQLRRSWCHRNWRNHTKLHARQIAM